MVFLNNKINNYRYIRRKTIGIVMNFTHFVVTTDGGDMRNFSIKQEIVRWKQHQRKKTTHFNLSTLLIMSLIEIKTQSKEEILQQMHGYFLIFC